MDTYARRIIAVTSTGSFLSVVNSSSLLIGIPAIIRGLQISFFEAIWILVAYGLVLTVLTPSFGKYSDAVGRKALYSAGYLFFAVGSAVSAVAIDGSVLLAGRILQGLAGSLLFSNSLAIVTDAMSPSELRRGMGLNSAVIALGTSIGPLIGGVLTLVTWRLIFIFNIPLAIAGFAMSQIWIRESRPRKKISMDAPSTVSLSAFLVVLVVFLTIAPGESFADPTISSILISTVLLFLIFSVIDIRSSRPIIDPKLFRIPSFTSSIYALITGTILRFTLLFGLVIYFQGPLGFSAFEAGLLVVPYAGAMGIFSLVAGYLKGKISDHTMQVLGLILSASGGIILSIFVLSHMGLDTLVAPMALAGGGNGLFFTPNSTISMLSVPADKRGETSGIRTLMTNLGSVLGLTLVFFALVSRIPSAIVDDIFLGVSAGVPSGVSNLFSSATFLAFFGSSVICLSSIPVMFSLRNRKTDKP
ncbi:MFS transporter [Thermoplasmatales archaeon AK]|nr:MFS transporter [Thermoplasmatales archaeon AK]